MMHDRTEQGWICLGRWSGLVNTNSRLEVLFGERRGRFRCYKVGRTPSRSPVHPSAGQLVPSAEAPLRSCIPKVKRAQSEEAHTREEMRGEADDAVGVAHDATAGKWMEVYFLVGQYSRITIQATRQSSS